jgi:SNF-related kinase
MLVCGHAPFQEANDSETLIMIMDCKYSVPQHISVDCKDLIAKMLIKEPLKRASLNEIAQDKWLLVKSISDNFVTIPLISREHITEDHHNLIITKMVNGNIATKEKILE